MDLLHVWLDAPLIQALILIAILVSGSITGYYAHIHVACDQKVSWLGFLRYFVGSVFSGIGALFIAESLDWHNKMGFVLYAYGCYMGPHMAKQLETLMTDLIAKNAHWRSKDK